MSEFKKRRICCTDEEIENISSEAWQTLLQTTSITSKFKSFENNNVDTTKFIEQENLELNETIKIINPSAHYKYSAIQLHLHEKNEIEKNSCNSSSSSSDSECESEIILKNQQSNITTEKLLPSEFYQLYVNRTKEQCAEELIAPQKSEKWLEARKYCITASQFGSAVGKSPYQSREALVIDKTWFLFKGNAACDWGNEHENHAKEAFCEWLNRSTKYKNKYKFIEENLIKSEDMPWMAVSPDGFIEYMDENGDKQIDLVEFKCPAYLRNTIHHPYSKWPENTPSQYYAQIQGIMGYLNMFRQPKIQKCWFVVWQPHQTWITLHKFNSDYYDTFLFPNLKDWYFKMFLPALTHKHNGLLEFGEIIPMEEIELF